MPFALAAQWRDATGARLVFQHGKDDMGWIVLEIVQTSSAPVVELVERRFGLGIS